MSLRTQRALTRRPQLLTFPFSSVLVVPLSRHQARTIPIQKVVVPKAELSTSPSPTSASPSSASSSPSRPSLVSAAPLRGTKDQFPDVTYAYKHIEAMMQFVCSLNGYEEVRTPILEQRDVFGETLGQTSEVVSKQMYSFDDQGTMVVLRPECTASVMRAISKRGPIQPPEAGGKTGGTKGDYPPSNSSSSGRGQNATTNAQREGSGEKSYAQLAEEMAKGIGGTTGRETVASDSYYTDRLYYCGPMFRRERPQAGRQRQFEQFGVECVGTDNIADDVQVIAMASDVINRLQLNSLVELRINSIGTLEDRSKYATVLKAYLSPYYAMLSEDSQRALDRDAPFRVLDSKHEKDIIVVRGINKAKEMGIKIPQVYTGSTTNSNSNNSGNPVKEDESSSISLPPPEGAPTILSCLSPYSISRHYAVLAGLRSLNISYVEDPLLFRGLDYYAHVTFEFVVKSKQVFAQSAVLAGGRYDNLGSRFSKQGNPGVGWAAGVDRIYLLMKENNLLVRPPVSRYAVISLCSRPTDDINHFDYIKSSIDSKIITPCRVPPELPGKNEGFSFGGKKGRNGTDNDIEDGYTTRKANGDNDNMHSGTHHNSSGNSNDFSQEELIDRLKKANKTHPPSQEPCSSSISSAAMKASKDKESALVDMSCLTFVGALRSVSVPTIFAPSLSFRAQIASAAALGVKYAIVIGGNEVLTDTVTVRDLITREQLLVRRDVALTCIRQDYKDSLHMEYEMGQAAALNEVYSQYDEMQ